MSERQTWYFTFGVGQPNAGRFVVIRDATADNARNLMHAKFDRVWAFQYDEADWTRGGVSQAEKYGLQLLEEIVWVEGLNVAAEMYRLDQAEQASAPVKPREGMVTVYGYDGEYVGCMGVETWQQLLAAGAAHSQKAPA